MSWLRRHAGARHALLCLCALAALSGCAGNRACNKPGPYSRSTSGPELRVPPDLSKPAEDQSFEVPEGAATAANSPPCGHYPPKIATATAPARASTNAAPPVSASPPPAVPTPPPAAPPAAQAAPAAPDSAAAPAASPELVSDLRALVLAWAGSWTGGNFEQYLQYYAQDFDPPGDLSVDEWRTARQGLIAKHPTLSVEPDTLTVRQATNDGATVEFVQHSEVDGVASTLRKGLVLVREDGAWRIRKETVVEALPNPR
jgi:hypothetical protein